MTPEIEKRIKLVQAGKVPAGYKRTKIGIVPKEWHEVRFHDMFSRLMRKNKEGNTNVLTISAQYGLINQEEFFNKTVASDDKSNYFLLEKGEFAYNKSYSSGYPFGALKRLDLYEKGVVSPLYICFSANAANECPDFYVHYFEAGLMNKEIQAFAQEGARNHGLLNIAVDDFFNSNLLCPPKWEQEKIAEILAAQDRVIELKEKLIAEKQTRKNYLMDQLFSGQKRLVGKTESFVSSAIGSVPSDWKLFLFETLFDVCKEHTENLIEYPLYSLTIENGVTPKTERYERQHLVKKENVYKILKPKYFAYNPMNIRFGAIGLHKKEFPVAVSGYYDTFTCKDPSILIFMEHFLKSDAMLNYYDKVSTGSLIEKKRVHLSQFLSFELPLPSIEEMRAIAKVLSAADEEISLLQKDLEQEKLKKKSLMQLLLTGLVRVSA